MPIEMAGIDSKKEIFPSGRQIQFPVNRFTLGRVGRNVSKAGTTQSSESAIHVVTPDAGGKFIGGAIPTTNSFPPLPKAQIR